MARKRVGLALSGGVGRGPAHIGVLLTLLEAGIPIDYVAGVSAGSIVGSLFCSGLGIDELLAHRLDLRWRTLAAPVFSPHGLVSFAPLARRLIEIMGDLTFDRLAIPFAVGVTDLNTAEPLVINSGKVAVAVHASCAVPGFVVPVHHQGRLLGDGGITCNLPGNVARAMGADYVIGVDLLVPKLRPRGGPLRYGLEAIETLVERSGGGPDAVDCLIRPDLAGYTYFDFNQLEDLVTRGRAAAQARLAEVRAAVFGADTLAPTAR